MEEKNNKFLPVSFGDINKNNFEHLRQLNNLNLPVRYQNGFYARLVAKLRYGKFAYYNDIIVGAITWKYDSCDNQRSIYIMTINVFDDYKRHQVGKFNLFRLSVITRTNKKS